MRITIYAVPETNPAVGTAVGYVDATTPFPGIADRAPRGGKILSYVGRTPHIDGQPVTHEDIAEPLQEGIDACARKVFGPDWVGSASVVSAIAVRTLSRSRILSHGLPVPMLLLLGRAVATGSPRAVGHLMQGVAWLWDEHVREYEADPEPGRMSGSGREALTDRLDMLLGRALDLVHEMQDSAAIVRGQKGALTKDRDTIP